MIKYVEGDLFKSDLSNKLICHVCNDQGAFGAGFVVPLAKAFPKAKKDYLRFYRSKLDGSSDWYVKRFGMGETQFSTQGFDTVVANMIAQDFRNGRSLRYDKLVKCMNQCMYYAKFHKLDIVSPKFGSDLAGGNWEFIEELIKDIWTDNGLYVTIHYLK